MPNTISKKSDLERIKDLVKLIQTKASPLPFERHNYATLSAIDRLSEAFEKIKGTQEHPNNDSKLPRVQKIESSKLPRVQMPNNNKISSTSKLSLLRADHQHFTPDQSKVTTKAQSRPCRKPTRSKTTPNSLQSNAGANEETGKLEEYRNLSKGLTNDIWINS